VSKPKTLGDGGAREGERVNAIHCSWPSNGDWYTNNETFYCKAIKTANLHGFSFRCLFCYGVLRFSDPCLLLPC